MFELPTFSKTENKIENNDIIIEMNKFVSYHYLQYFLPEIKPFLNEEWFPKYGKYDFRLRNNKWIGEIKQELNEDFYKNRKIEKVKMKTLFVN